MAVSKKSVSPAVQKAVQTAVPVVAPVAKPAKQFSIEDYLREYRASYAAGETIAEMSKRTGMTVTAIRQTIGNFGDKCRAKRADVVNASPAFLKQLAAKKISVEEYVSKWWSTELPPLKHSETRNTKTAQLSDELAGGDLVLLD